MKSPPEDHLGNKTTIAGNNKTDGESFLNDLTSVSELTGLLVNKNALTSIDHAYTLTKPRQNSDDHLSLPRDSLPSHYNNACNQTSAQTGRISKISLPSAAFHFK